MCAVTLSCVIILIIVADEESQLGNAKKVNDLDCENLSWAQQHDKVVPMRSSMKTKGEKIVDYRIIQCEHTERLISVHTFRLPIPYPTSKV